MELPWVEKYRPKKVSEVAHQEFVVKTLEKSLESGNVPHLLLYGPPGTGKTTVALALAKQFYGEHYKERTLELNASDERGIKIVREKIKNFANKSVANRKVNGKDIAPFKMIILDEADSMTNDAQSALRRMMEVFTNVTRFCLICNYVSRIIEPVASRCAKFRFQPLSTETMKNRFQLICNAEGVTFESEAFDDLIEVTEGDMRRGINLLQTASECNSNIISRDVISEISGKIPKIYINKLIDIVHGNSFKELQLFCDEIVYEGFGIDVFFDQILEAVVTDEKLSDQQKSLICLKIAEADARLSNGADSQMQLLAVVSDTFKICHYQEISSSLITS